LQGPQTKVYADNGDGGVQETSEDRVGSRPVSAFRKCAIYVVAIRPAFSYSSTAAIDTRTRRPILMVGITLDRSKRLTDSVWKFQRTASSAGVKKLFSVGSSEFSTLLTLALLVIEAETICMTAYLFSFNQLAKAIVNASFIPFKIILLLVILGSHCQLLASSKRHLRVNMARRGKNGYWIGLVAPLAGVVVMLSLISPQVQQMISAVGFLAICLLGLVVVGFVGFGVYRFAARSQRAEAMESDADWKPVNVGVKREQKQVETITDLIGQLRAIDWFQFEKLVALVYGKLGYAVARRGGANPDGGIDLVIQKDYQCSAVQCKQWKTRNVGVKPVREFLGALTDARIQKGIFITLGGYTDEAKQLAEKHGIEIVNEVGLAKILEDTGARLDPDVMSLLTDKRKFCPKCESEMILRTARKGAGAGHQFWGCSAYGKWKCQFTMPVS
jgi:Restriction endonuclease